MSRSLTRSSASPVPEESFPDPPRRAKPAQRRTIRSPRLTAERHKQLALTPARRSCQVRSDQLARDPPPRGPPPPQGLWVPSCVCRSRRMRFVSTCAHAHTRALRLSVVECAPPRREGPREASRPPAANASQPLASSARRHTTRHAPLPIYSIGDCSHGYVGHLLLCPSHDSFAPQSTPNIWQYAT